MDNRVVADPVAIVSIVAGATVAIAVPFINARLERRRMRWQSETARLDELRALLDTALVHMYEAGTVLYEWEQEAQKDTKSAEWSPDRFRALSTSLTAKFDEVERDHLRIEVRLPDGTPITQKHGRLLSLLMRCELEYRRYVEDGRLEQRRKPPVEVAVGSGPQMPKNPWQEAGDAIAEFVNEVRALIGATSEARRTQPSQSHSGD